MRTLRNAIEQDKVHHAYLFVGSRGTGKTSMAKILAACAELRARADGRRRAASASRASRSPSATSLDVIEMDAASNNSVDDIRDLRERVAYAPVSGRHKVYILDEAHMLSHGGVERVPQDARGAAAAHDLRARHDRGPQGAADGRRPLPPLRLRAPDACAQIAARAAARRRRGVDRDPRRGGRADRPLTRPARSATRSARSSSCVTYSGAAIALDDVLAVLGVADADLLFGAVDAVAAGDARAALLAAARLAESGRDLGRFFGDLEAHARGAAGRADARRGARPSCASRPSRTSAWPSRPRRVGAGRRRPAARPARRRACAR